MTVQTLTLGKRRFVVVPEKEFDRMRRESRQYKELVAEDRALGALAEKELRAFRKKGSRGTRWDQVKAELGRSNHRLSETFAVRGVKLLAILSASIIFLSPRVSLAQATAPIVGSSNEANSGPEADSRLREDFRRVIESDNAAKVLEWLKAHPSAIDANLDRGRTLDSICTFGTPEMLDAYRSAGGSLKWKDNKRGDAKTTYRTEPPILHIVQNQGSEDRLVKMVDKLLEAGADINDSGLLGNCLAYFSINWHFRPPAGNPEVRLRVLDHLLRLGADINSTGTDHAYSVLHQAASDGDAAFVEALLQRGANVNVPGKETADQPFPDPNYTPLHLALKRQSDGAPVDRVRFQQTVEVLLRHGGR